jgi:hypothetical protein
MEVNRIFICYIKHNENTQETQKRHYLISLLKRADIEILTDQGDESAEHFFPQLQEKLSTCQAFILLQTLDTVSAPRVRLAVRVALRLARQKRMQVFRLISSLKTEKGTLQEWKALTTFDGTHDYQRTCKELVSAITANSSKSNTKREAVTRGTLSPLPRIGLLKTPSQTASERLQKLPSQASDARSQLVPSVGTRTGASPVPTKRSNKPQRNLVGVDEASPVLTVSSPRALPMATVPTQTMTEKLSQRRKDTNKTRGRRPLLMLTLLTLVILLIIGSAGTLFFLSGSKSILLTPIVGQVSFISSNQKGTDYNTGICDEIQVNLNHLTPPTAGKSYYAWLLPDRGHSEESAASFLGRLTVNNGTVSMTYTNPTYENLLLTKSRFLITEESTSSSPRVPSPDQHIWRYSAAISQTPHPQDPQHYSYLDHIRHLLAQDLTLQELGMQGGLDAWFYENVKSVLKWARTAQDAGNSKNFPVLHSNVVSILDYLDGINLVASDVPPGTPITADPQLSRVPILSLDTDSGNQKPSGYIHHIETHLQGLADSSDATDAQRTLAGKIDNELNTINGLLQQVRQDAKQLVNLSNTQIATSAAASLLADLVEKANSAFAGQLDPATNRQRGGVTQVHEALPQLATLNVKEVNS